jgi:cell division protein FtsL
MAQTSLAYDRQAFRRNTNTVRHRSTTDGFGPITKTLLLVMIVGMFGLLYLTQITKTSSYSYQISELENTRDEMRQENQSLAVQAARLKSIERIEKSTVAKTLTNQGEVSYAQ